MKLNQLKSIIKESVKEAIQEEMKEILIEAVKTPRQVVVEDSKKQETLPNEDKLKLRENMMGVLGDMMNNNTITSKNIGQPLQIKNTDTMTGSLPEGEVNMSQIMGLMNKK